MAQDDMQSAQNSQFEEEQYALAADELAALQARLTADTADAAAEEAPAAASVPSAAQQEKTERLLRGTPKVAPSAGFADRVMAAIAALPLPEYMRREMGVGLALGLFAAALLVVPALSIAFVMLVSTLISPGAWGGIMHSAIDAANYVGGLLLSAGDEVESLVSGTPVLPAVVGITIPLVAIWGWVLWQFWGKGRVSLRR